MLSLFTLPDLGAWGLWGLFVGDIFSIALGFYKTNPWLTAMLMLVGKTLRFFFWNLILGVI